MSHDPSKPSIQRRRLFAGAGTASALAAAAVTLPLVREADVAAPTAKPAPEQGGGYQLTQHVLRYYQTTKI
ncbi:MAG: formate dehydrogenase [Burkholderiales bacterium]|nr:formate dehydrogenase [Burkholderiales bacterium]